MRLPGKLIKRERPISQQSPSNPERPSQNARPVCLQPGDIVLVRSASPLGRAIRWAERGPGEPPAWANHAGLITQAGNQCTALITEALWQVVEQPLSRTGQLVQIWRHRHWHPAHRQAVARRMKSFIGCRYGWWKLALHLTDALIGRLGGLLGLKGEPVLARRLLFAGQRPICSWVVAWSVFAATGLRFKGLAPQAASPDDIHDHLQGDGAWEMVYENQPARDCPAEI